MCLPRFLTQLGAAVVLTDREEAPWVLQNMRGAVAANGLNSPPGAAAAPVAAAAGGGAGGGDGVQDARTSGGDGGAGDAGGGAGESGRAGGLTAEANGEGREGEGEGGTAGGQGAGAFTAGTCVVEGLSWGSVGAAAIRRAREEWRPQVRQ